MLGVFFRPGSIPFELVNDGDLLLLLERMLHLRGLDTVRISEVNGLADEGMVLDGRVREIDRLGNDAADEAADLGRRRVGRMLSGPSVTIGADDVAQWPYTPGLLVKWVSF